MSRTSVAVASRATVSDPLLLAPSTASAFRIPHRILIDVLILIDIGIVVFAAVLAKYFYIALFLESGQTVEPYVVAGLVGGVVTHYTMRSRGLHEPVAILGWRSRLYDLIMAIGLSFLVLLAFAYLFKLSSDFSRGWLLTWLMLVLALMPLSRPAAAWLLSWLASTGSATRRIAIVSSGATGQQLADSLRRMEGIRVVGVFEPGDQEYAGESMDELLSVGQRNEIDEVIIAVSNALQPRTARLIEELSILPIDIWLNAADFHLPILGTARLGGVSLLQVKPKPIRDWGYLCKLMLDYVAAAVCLVLLAPLMLLIALSIRLESSGPALFRQRRHGYNHCVIDVYKFRTMNVIENGARIEQARKNDPRVTRIGKFLRRTSLDELPQLFNVLKGEMSLVGPRPHAVAHNVYYRERMERYANRHCVKPGMTGWAQVNGFRGPTDDAEKMRKRVQLDLYYIENWSLWLDLKILVLTPFVGFMNRNAF